MKSCFRGLKVGDRVVFKSGVIGKVIFVDNDIPKYLPNFSATNEKTGNTINQCLCEECSKLIIKSIIKVKK